MLFLINITTAAKKLKKVRKYCIQQKFYRYKIVKLFGVKLFIGFEKLNRH